MDIVMTGGQTETLDILSYFDLNHMDYMIIQYQNNTVNFGYTGQLITQIDNAISRLHIFGEGGDLTVRRDENIFYWRFVGHETLLENLIGRLYPDENMPLSIDGETKALLWGRYQGEGAWQEDIVGKATLGYPTDDVKEAEHTMIFAHIVKDKHNQSVAYWTYRLGLPEYDSQENE